MTPRASARASKRLLWVDDQIDNFEPWFQRFSENGVSVDPFPSVEDAFEGMGSRTYDAILLDQLMPGRRGSEALMQFRTKAPNAPLYICSGYFYLDDVMDEVEEGQRQSGVTINRIDKTNLPLTDDPNAIARFLKTIFNDPEATERMAQEANQKLTALSEASAVLWADYSCLDLSGKLEVHDRIDRLTANSREKCARDGIQYMIFCGSWSAPVYTSGEEGQFLDEGQLLRLALDTGFAPFAYSTGGAVDDLTRHCSVRNNMRGYPAIRMAKGGREEAVHFDTGNPMSLLSYEHYTMNGWIDPIHTIDTHFAGTEVLRGKRQRLEDVIFTDSQAATRFGVLTAFAVLMWGSHRFAARCLPDCKCEFRLGEAACLCYFRNGLLGRTLGRDLDCEFQVSVDTGSVLFRTRAS